MAGFALIALIATVAAPAPLAAGPAGVDPDGQWGPLEDWPLIAIHAALLPDGDVLTYGTDANGIQGGYFIYDVWDSSGSAGTGHTTLANTTQTDLFCSIQLLRPETGDMVLFGGDNWDVADGSNDGWGNNDINLYDPIAQTMTTIDQMVLPRWYATAITLADGSIYIQGGEGADPGWEDQGLIGPPTAEHWSEETGTIALPFDTGQLRYWYPRNFVLPDGRIFGFDTRGNMYYISADLQTLTHVDDFSSRYKGKGSTAVMFEPGKILQVSGSSNEAMVIDATGTTPVITPTADLSSHRDWGEATLLPDGRVLVVGGSSVHNELEGVNYAAEIWDPATGQWTLGAEAAIARLYHSSSLLLPDGRVLVAGGGAPGPLINTNAEIYSPDYLVAADGSPMPRPSITGLDTTTVYAGDQLVVSVDDATDIDRVTLLKSGSATHSFNVEQRILEPTFSVAGDDLTVDIPTNGNNLTPGYWLVTVIDDNGIPSESEIVQVPPGTAPPLPPPVITPGGIGGPEGDSGSSVVDVPVRLDRAFDQPLTVDWQTWDSGYPGIATAGEDYIAASGTATFLPGETETSVPVTIFGDTDPEPGPLWGEWLPIIFSNPSPEAELNVSFFGLGLVILGNDD